MAQPRVYPVLSAEELHSLCKPICLYVLSFQVICKDWSNLAGKNYIILNMSDNIDCVSQSAEICWHGRNGAERCGGRHSSCCVLSLQNILKALILKIPTEAVERRTKIFPFSKWGKSGWISLSLDRVSSRLDFD